MRSQAGIASGGVQAPERKIIGAVVEVTHLQGDRLDDLPGLAVRNPPQSAEIFGQSSALTALLMAMI